MRTVIAILVSLFVITSGHADDLDAARADGAILLMRHALAPGTGDPVNFKLGDCSTQRNLSDEGRNQARHIGARLRQAGVSVTHVLTSQWCRFRETAALLDLGPVEELASLNSFFADRTTEPEQTRATLERLAGFSPTERPILVTHQVNITALTGIVPRSGEIIIVERADGALRVTGRFLAD